jgi:hypothetical protein
MYHQHNNYKKNNKKLSGILGEMSDSWNGEENEQDKPGSFQKYQKVVKYSNYAENLNNVCYWRIYKDDI